MNTDSNGDWSAYIALFVAGGFPWITQIKNLNIHFTYKNQEYKEVFNAFATLFAFSIFFFLKTEVTDKFAFYFGYWQLILFIAFVMVVIYLGLLLHKANKETVAGMLIAFVIYVSIFCTLVYGFGLLYFEKDYYMIDGTVKGVNDESVLIEVYADEELAKVVNTDTNGNFYLTLQKGLDYTRIIVYHNNQTTTTNIYAPIYSSFENLSVEKEKAAPTP